MRRIIMLAAIALGAGFLTRADAQGRRDRGLVEVERGGIRGGFYLVGSFGAGREQCRFETAPCAILDSHGDALPGTGETWRKGIDAPAFDIRVGGTPSQNLRVGGEIFGWSTDNGPTTESSAGLLANVQFYPSGRAGLYLKGGIGYGLSAVDYHDGYKPKVETGFLLSFGAGYEFPVGDNFAVGPTVDLFHGSYPHLGDETLRERILFVGVSLTYQAQGHRNN